MQQHPKYNPDNAIQFGRQLRNYRHEKHIPISIAAICIGISVAHLSNIELGYEVVPAAFADTLFYCMDMIVPYLPENFNYCHQIAIDVLTGLDVPVFNLLPYYALEQPPYKEYYGRILKDKKLYLTPIDDAYNACDVYTHKADKPEPTPETHPALEDIEVLSRWLAGKVYCTLSNELISIINIRGFKDGVYIYYSKKDELDVHKNSNTLGYLNVYRMHLNDLKFMLSKKTLFPLNSVDYANFSYGSYDI